MLSIRANKVFHRSKAILECLDYDLQYLGLSYIKERYRTMTSIKSLNDEYTICFDRSDSNSIYGNYSYICSMRFVDIIGNTILSLSFNEIDAFVLIDSMVSYMNDNLPDVIVLSTSDTYMNTYNLIVDRCSNDRYHTITIRQYNSIHETMIDILRFYMNDDQLDNMIYSMYFSYLIDIDNGDYISDIMDSSLDNFYDVSVDNHPYMNKVINTIPDE